MNPKNHNDGTVETDLQLISRIADGDAVSWEKFVTRYSGWVMYRARKWCESHCRYHSQDVHCELVSLSRRLGGLSPGFLRTQECDDGMDSYIWIMEKLQKRITRYSARNGSRLSTFVWSILNSREFYIDWLRWKYGRVF
jgi:hypothetical protein